MIQARPLQPPLLEGPPHKRGREAVELDPEMGAAFVKRLDNALQLREEEGEHDWLAERLAQLKALFPEVAEYLAGQAEALAIRLKDLIASCHIDLLKDRRRTRRATEIGEAAWEAEECSTFAFPVAPAVGIAAKNRDNAPGASRRHTILLHADPAWGENGWVLAVSSFGGPMVASSGMNHHGLAVVCNAGRTREVRDGLHKAFVMDAMLGRCTSVEEALDLIRSVPHAGEGNLVLADRHGHVAAVELAGETPFIEQPASPAWVARTNHFASPQNIKLSRFQQDNPAEGVNSRGRLSYLHTQLSPLDLPLSGGWESVAAQVTEILSFHDASGETSVCLDNELKYTASGAVFRCHPPALLISDGPPCRGQWRFWEPTALELEILM